MRPVSTELPDITDIVHRIDELIDDYFCNPDEELEAIELSPLEWEEFIYLAQPTEVLYNGVPIRRCEDG